MKKAAANLKRIWKTCDAQFAMEGDAVMNKIRSLRDRDTPPFKGNWTADSSVDPKIVLKS